MKRKCHTCAWATGEDYEDYVETRKFFGLIPTYEKRTVYGWVCRWMPSVRKVQPDGWCYQWKEFRGKERGND